MNLFEGLFFYEILLMVSGAILFLIFLVLMVYFFIKDKNILYFFPLLLIVILMISFSGFQKIKFNKLVDEIREITQSIDQDKPDIANLNLLKEKLNKIEKRPVSTPLDLQVLAEGNLAIGDTSKALIYINRVLQENPDYQDMIKLKERISNSRKEKMKYGSMFGNDSLKELMNQIVAAMYLIKETQINLSS